jgi:hypothetical protein
MNIDNLKKILSTTAITLKIKSSGINVFCLMPQTITSYSNGIEIYDYVEDKKYLITQHTELDFISTKYFSYPSDKEFINYEDFHKNNSSNIQINNNKSLLTFTKIKEFYQQFNDDDTSINRLKLLNHFCDVEILKRFGIRNLENFYTNRKGWIDEAKLRVTSMLENSMNSSISKLNDERNLYVSNNDTSSIEEVDLVISLIKESVAETTFDDVNELNDFYKAWPRILLPTPF